MKQCPDIIYQYMHEYLDEDLPPEHEEILKNHLQSCSECRKHFYELKKTETFIKSMANVHAPSGFTDQVLANLPKESKKNRLKKWFGQHPFLTAASIFIILMLSSTFSSWNQDHNFSVTKKPNIVIENNTAIVPEGETIQGDIIVKNGDIRIEGKVEGNVTVINGNKYLASAGKVTGEIEEINQVFEWIWFQIKTSVNDLLQLIKGSEEENNQ